LARTFAIALAAAVFVVLSLAPGSPASATAPASATGASAIVLLEESPPAPDHTSEEGEAWRGDVPIKGVIGGTAALLGVLIVVAVRREWVI
jgi:hypothetical protein